MFIIETPINMENKKLIVFYILGLILTITFVSAMDITFFYSESCPYCQQIKPSIFEYAKLDINNHWNLYETSYPENNELFKSYGFTGVPAFVIKTNDNREIKFTGTNLKKLSCELNEMTTKDCPTYPASNCIKGSLFIE